MSNRIRQVNKQFMIGNAILAIGLIFIVCLFLYLSFRKATADSNSGYAEKYELILDTSLQNDSVAMFINDSLIINTTVRDSLSIEINRFDEQSMLSIENKLTGNTTNVNLPEKNSKVRITKEGTTYLVNVFPML
ncbi:MAG: hypothetical protein PUK62_09260 [Prevotellaceae bacterium]|nr:hypothetical protein [Prevotellaceae bacterium]